MSKMSKYKFEKVGADLPCEVDTILEGLCETRVCKLEKVDNNEFTITEWCDSCFSLTLAKDELIALSEEIRAFAGR